MSVDTNDPFSTLQSPILHGAGDDVFPITPSDTVDLATAVRALRVTTAGNVQVTTRAGQTRVMAFVAAETRLCRVSRVWSTNTTATGIEGIV